MKKELEQVKEFHNKFNHPIEESPEIPRKSRCDLRHALIAEELAELKVAYLEGDLTEVADALVDLQYVLNGTILEFGLQDKFEDLFNEVHRSNMSKACNTAEDAIKTQKFYKEKGVDTYLVVNNSGFFVYRKSDDKILKSINYSPADLKTILEK